MSEGESDSRERATEHPVMPEPMMTMSVVWGRVGDCVFESA